MRKALLAVAVALVAFAANASTPAQETTCAQCASVNLDCCVKSTGAIFCCWLGG